MRYSIGKLTVFGLCCLLVTINGCTQSKPKIVQEPSKPTPPVTNSQKPEPAATTEPPKPEPPKPIEPKPEPKPTTSELKWDKRLDDMKVSLVPANVAAGEVYWKLIRADYENEFQHDIDFGGDHHIYYVLTDENGKRVPNQEVWQSWPEEKTSALSKDSGNENGVANIAMWSNYFPEKGPGPYTAYVGGLPSDEVHGMGLPANHHVSFILYFQKTIAEGGK